MSSLGLLNKIVVLETAYVKEVESSDVNKVKVKKKALKKKGKCAIGVDFQIICISTVNI